MNTSDRKELIEQVLRMRENGTSFGIIAQMIGYSESTISRWIRRVDRAAGDISEAFPNDSRNDGPELKSILVDLDEALTYFQKQFRKEALLGLRRLDASKHQDYINALCGRLGSEANSIPNDERFYRSDYAI